MSQLTHLERLSVSMLVLGMQAQQSYVQRFAAVRNAGSALLPRRSAATYLAAVGIAGEDLLRRFVPPHAMLSALGQSEADGGRA